MPIIPARRRLKQEDCKFQVSLSNVVRLKIERKKERKEGGEKGGT
jgi:hypothetical protein